MALLEVPEAADTPTVRVGRVNQDLSGDLVVDNCWAIGFPQYADVTRDGSVVHATAQVRGCIPPLSGFGPAEQLLSLEVTATPQQLPDRADRLSESPWSGMSGAGVFGGDVLLGVITEHAERRGESDISFTPLAGLFDPERAPPNPDRWRARLGIGSSEELELLPVPYRGTEPAYRATLRAVRRVTGQLLGRERELEQLEAFATGAPDAFRDETTAGRYLWLKAGPWAGKTALLAEAVSLAPERLDVVAFFINARVSQVTQDQFFAAVIPQLAFLLDRDPPAVQDINQFRSLWEQAEQHSTRHDRRLVLVVDGLDEGTDIARLLPAQPGPRSCVIVSSRPGLDPDDLNLDVDHALRSTTPIPLMSNNPAEELQYLAQQEIKDLLRSGNDSSVAYKILGVLAAAGGGLSVMDLAEVTGLDAETVYPFVTGPARRSLLADGHHSERHYVFAHLTLQDTCCKHDLVGNSKYWHSVTAWADQWAANGWRGEDGSRATPYYLLDAYPHALAGPDNSPPRSPDAHDRLAALTTDFSWLDSAVGATGVDRVLAALRSADRRRPDDTAVRTALRLVELQANHLRPPRPVDRPGYPTTQLALEALRRRAPELAARAHDRLAVCPGPQIHPGVVFGARQSRICTRLDPSRRQCVGPSRQPGWPRRIGWRRRDRPTVGPRYARRRWARARHDSGVGRGLHPGWQGHLWRVCHSGLRRCQKMGLWRSNREVSNALTE